MKCSSRHCVWPLLARKFELGSIQRESAHHLEPDRNHGLAPLPIISVVSARTQHRNLQFRVRLEVLRCSPHCPALLRQHRKGAGASSRGGCTSRRSSKELGVLSSCRVHLSTHPTLYSTGSSTRRAGSDLNAFKVHAPTTSRGHKTAQRACCGSGPGRIPATSAK
jgi:hypothetical protein